MKLTLTAKTNSFTINGLEFQKGSLSVNHSDDGISINGAYGQLSDISCDGDTFSDIDDLKNWISDNLFKSGGGDGSGSQSGVESVTGNLVVGTSKNPVISLIGTPSDVVKFDSNNNPYVGRLDITQISDINSFPSFANGIIAATSMNAVDKTGLILVLEFSTDTPKAGTFPSYISGGRLVVGNASQPSDAINLGQINGFLSKYSPLDEAGLIPLQYLNVSGLSFKGAWNAATNTPTLLDGTGNVGDFYKCSEIKDGDGNDTSFTRNFGNGDHTFTEGDWVIFAAGVWQRLGSSEIVNSVNGKIGMVVISKSDVGLASVDNTSDINKPISNPTKTYVDDALGSLTSLISSTTANGFKIDDYTDRLEYKAKIPFTFNFATGVSHWTITTAFILPVGVTVGSSDEHYISIMNSNRAIGVSTWDGTDRAMRIGFFNTYTAGPHTASGSIFIKLVKYK